MQRQRGVTVRLQRAHQAGQRLVAHLQVGELQVVEVTQRQAGEELELGADGAAAEGGHVQLAADAVLRQPAQVGREIAVLVAAHDGGVEERLALHHHDVGQFAGWRGLLQHLLQRRGGLRDQPFGGGAIGFAMAAAVLQMEQHQRADQARMVGGDASRPRLQPQHAGVVDFAPRGQAHQHADERGRQQAAGGEALAATAPWQHRRLEPPRQHHQRQRRQQCEVRPRALWQVAGEQMHAALAQLADHAEIIRQQRRAEVGDLERVDPVDQPLQGERQPEREPRAAAPRQQHAGQQQAGQRVGQREPRLLEQLAGGHPDPAVDQPGQQHEDQRQRQHQRDARGPWPPLAAGVGRVQGHMAAAGVVMVVSKM
ncbi:hypothetical protein RLIN73S_00480 [Rhodanobacter lindaniclasticus]